MKRKNRTWRVGSFTAGISLILFGILFFLHNVVGLWGVQVIFQLWPIVLIIMGIELFLSNFFVKELVYDKTSVVILLLFFIFASVMSCMDVGLDLLIQEWK